MGDDDWFARALDRIDHGSIPTVSEIDTNTDVIHLTDAYPSKLGETGIGLLETAAAERATLVVSKLSDAKTELVHDADQPGVILDFGCDTLNPKDHTQLVLAFGAPDVFPGQDVEQPWLNLEVTIVSVHGADESPEVIATHPDTANSKRHILRRHPSG